MGRPVMNKTGCFWALFFSMIFWLGLALILWGIL